MRFMKEFVSEVQKQEVTYQAKLFLERRTGQVPTCTPFFLVVIHPKNGSPMKSKNFIGDPIPWSNNNFDQNQIIATIIHQIHKNGPNISSIYVSKMFYGIRKEAVSVVFSISR